MICSKDIQRTNAKVPNDWWALEFRRETMKTPAAAVLVVLASITAIPAAHAWDDDVRSDWRRVERDRTHLHSDYARLREKEQDIAATERRENSALRHGRLWQAWRAERAERREEADIRYLRHK